MLCKGVIMLMHIITPQSWLSQVFIGIHCVLIDQCILHLFWLLHVWRFTTIWVSEKTNKCKETQSQSFLSSFKQITCILLKNNYISRVINLLSCSWLWYVMMTLFPSDRRPVVGRLLPVLRMCLKVMSVWPLRVVLPCLCFLSDIRNKPERRLWTRVSNQWSTPHLTLCLLYLNNEKSTCPLVLEL